MNILLLFFAFPVATIILSIVLEKILRCPILTAATFFAIYLIVTFAAFDASFLVFVITYTILAFVVAAISESFFRRCKDENEYRNNNTITLSNQDIRRIAEQLVDMQRNNACNKNNNNNCNCINEVATVNVTNNTTGGRTNWCCYRR